MRFMCINENANIRSLPHYLYNKPLAVKRVIYDSKGTLKEYVLEYEERYKKKEVTVNQKYCEECVNIKGSMILVAIKPKSPDINDMVYGMLLYSKIHAVAKETGRTVTIKCGEKMITFDKKYILKRW